MVSNIGSGTVRGTMPPTGENRRRIESAVADLVCGLDGWLAGLDPEQSAEPWPQALAACKEINELLGTATPLKRFLVAMLWKKMKMQKGTGLLTAHPEAFRARWLCGDAAT